MLVTRGKAPGVVTAPNIEGAPTRRAPLLTVSNHHTESSGEPPAVDGDAPETYVGYFCERVRRASDGLRRGEERRVGERAPLERGWPW